MSQIVRNRVEEPRVVCIVGMHRSGTSVLAGTLRESGLYLGKVIARNPHNPLGDVEHGPIRWLNESILEHNGGSWRNPPRDVAWSHAHVGQRDAIVRSFAPVRVWGFKDPRTLLALAFWEEGISRLEFVGTFRHPLAVAESLIARDGGTRDEWLALWHAYNEKLLALHEARPFALLDYDLDVDKYRAALASAAAALGLHPKARPRFFRPELRHRRRHETDDLPSPIAEIYTELRARAGA